MLLCPTHEALKQLKAKIQGQFEFRTLHSALGIAPQITEEGLAFEQLALPNIWDHIDLAIVDECSMVSEEILDILMRLNKKILFVGHNSQLPPVLKEKSVFDECVSPVFSQGFPTVTLKIPMRNQGELWQFNNKLEEMIYNKEKLVPNTFNINSKGLQEYLHSDGITGKLIEGSLKIALWSNAGVEEYNGIARQLIFGDASKDKRYLVGDRVVLTTPTISINGLERFTDASLTKAATSKFDTIYSNTQGTVLECIEETLMFNKKLPLDVVRLKLKLDTGDTRYVYELKNPAQAVEIKNYYMHRAYAMKTLTAKEKAFKLIYFVLSLFTRFMHSYAMTSHRLQGSSIDSVIVIYRDIQKNQNLIEQKKCMYVACSRAMNNLMIYRG